MERYAHVIKMSGIEFAETLARMELEGWEVLRVHSKDAPSGVCVQWEAVLRKERENERGTPKDETAELLEAAKRIRAACRLKSCAQCEFDDDGFCRITDSIPCDWKI